MIKIQCEYSAKQHFFTLNHVVLMTKYTAQHRRFVFKMVAGELTQVKITFSLCMPASIFMHLDNVLFTKNLHSEVEVNRALKRYESLFCSEFSLIFVSVIIRVVVKLVLPTCLEHPTSCIIELLKHRRRRL